MGFINRNLTSTFLATLALGFAQAAHAQTDFNFTLANATNIENSSNNPLAGTSNATGTLVATPNGDGSFTAISGTVTVTGFDAGTYTLVTNPLAPNVSNVNSGTIYINYDDQLFPNQTPVLDENGLLFVNGSSYYNIYNGENVYVPVNTYQFYDGNGNQSFGTSSSFTLTAVPEPSAMLGFGGFCVAGGLVFLRRRLPAHKAA